MAAGLGIDASMPSLTFGWMPVREALAAPNLPDLIRAHWDELAVHKTEMVLAPNYQRFAELGDVGQFRVWAAKDGKTLVGYVGFFVQPHIHYQNTLTAVEDLFLLSAPYRKGGNGLKMFSTAIDALRELGVKRVILHSKVHFEKERGGLGRFFQRLGFEHTDNIYSRML
jgi:GNAT superfamily N-acetyltransferase